MENIHFDTLQVHGGRRSGGSNTACATPIYQTSSFLFDNSKHAADLFELKTQGHIYTRLSNPTTEVLEKRIAALEGGSEAVAVSSGQASQFLTIATIAGKGDNIICSSSLYGGTYNQFDISFRKLGIDFRFAPRGDVKEFEKLIDKSTKALFVETIGNSDFYIPDFEKIAELSRKHGIPLIIDNTFGAAGYVFRPIEWGANIITHAATKWIGGHGSSIGGIIVDCGNFDWGNGNFPDFTAKSVSYHGLNFWESFGGDSGKTNRSFAVKARAEGLRDWGCCMSPFNAFLLAQGVETLSLRMDRILSNARELAEWLHVHPLVAGVKYPGLKTDPNHEFAKKYLRHGYGGVLSFDIKGDREKTAGFIESLELLSHLVNVGDNKTLISHFASTTHAQLSDKALQAAGIGPNTLRISLGIEHIEDIKKDIEQAFKKAGL